MKTSAGVIKFVEYKVAKVIFELNVDFEWDDGGLDIVFDAESSKYVSEDGKQMIVELVLKIFNDEEQEYPFRMELELVGAFELQQNVDDIEKYYANALSILYPYARAIVSNYTANANVEPLILPTVNIWKMINEKNNK